MRFARPSTPPRLAASSSSSPITSANSAQAGPTFSKSSPAAASRIGIKINDGTDDPVLFAVQATDEAALAKFVERATEAIEQEMARTESKDKLTKEKHQDFDTLALRQRFACVPDRFGPPVFQ